MKGYLCCVVLDIFLQFDFLVVNRQLRINGLLQGMFVFWYLVSLLVSGQNLVRIFVFVSYFVILLFLFFVEDINDEVELLDVCWVIQNFVDKY